LFEKFEGFELFKKFEGFELFEKFEGFELFKKFEGFIKLPVPERSRRGIVNNFIGFQSAPKCQNKNRSLVDH
jgi:hypothetical protein